MNSFLRLLGGDIKGMLPFIPRLVHVDDVVAAFLGLLYATTVSELARLIPAFRDSRDNLDMFACAV